MPNVVLLSVAPMIFMAKIHQLLTFICNVVNDVNILTALF
jgi:hypothetical protein